MKKLLLNKPDYSLQQVRMGDLDISSDFFTSFIESYSPYYRDWFEKKRDDNALTVKENGLLRGFLKLKIEDVDEDYSDISPIFLPARRLKISSLKVEPNDADISRLFMEIALAEARINNVDEIYATMISDSDYKIRLAGYLEKWGFRKVGRKFSFGIVEDIFTLPVSPAENDRNLIIKPSEFLYEYDSASNPQSIFRYDFCKSEKS